MEASNAISSNTVLFCLLAFLPLIWHLSQFPFGGTFPLANVLKGGGHPISKDPPQQCPIFNQISFEYRGCLQKKVGERGFLVVSQARSTGVCAMAKNQTPFGGKRSATKKSRLHQPVARVVGVVGDEDDPLPCKRKEEQTPGQALRHQPGLKLYLNKPITGAGFAELLSPLYCSPNPLLEAGGREVLRSICPVLRITGT